MTADPRNTVSEITEITDKELGLMIGSFFRATGWGAVAGGGFFLVFTVPAGLTAMISQGDPQGLLLGLLPLGIALAGTLIGMLLIGLPLTALLRQFRRERAPIFAAVGMVGGLVLPMLFAALLEGAFNSGTLWIGFFFGLFGALAGGVCGKIWGSYREDVARAADGPEGAPTNPFHDMIY
ncbi:hypothetical protein [Aurantiacibacter rhizosphaerae]|uniref:Uncharacterized protein n=1 Tax=Aurantiacibacter rhizosphaerae TaxID=2691582 RepID=A0A844XH18_9SPHN|nr:hypothetical protein [Aurantiacibacter rhizosphaerae]MWV28815.1 hypothetical protein [Aurantiacibacter rhizosphaerae]